MKNCNKVYALVGQGKFILSLLLISTGCLAGETPKVTSAYIDRPLWALSLEEADWLLPDKGGEGKTLGFFSFSHEKTNMPEKATVQQEDDTGRTTRSLPIYLAERINLDTACNAENHIFVVKGSGPVVSGKEWDRDILLDYLGDNAPDYIVTGHIKQDYLDTRTTITLNVWDTEKQKEVMNISESALFSQSQNVAAVLPGKFFQKINTVLGCETELSTRYPRPPEDLLPVYLDALGQLLAQTLTQNGMMPAEAIWGEENMLNWYLDLWESFPQSDAPKLMYIRGVLASVEYGGVAEEKFAPNLISYLSKIEQSNRVLNRLSPLIYARLGQQDKCEKQKSSLQKLASRDYAKWLTALDCKIN